LHSSDRRYFKIIIIIIKPIMTADQYNRHNEKSHKTAAADSAALLQLQAVMIDK
jgi:hypothetical protein